MKRTYEQIHQTFTSHDWLSIFWFNGFCYVSLALLNVSKPVGNEQLGYAYALFLLGAGLAFSGLLLTITIVVKGGFLIKIKAHSDWEAQLLALLRCECAYQEVYYFLSGNLVEHPEAFVEPLNQSIDWLSAFISKRIKANSSFGEREFEGYGISHLLQALDNDQFVRKDTAFYPHITQLKLALETLLPKDFSGIHFTATDEVKMWLTNHKK